MKLIRKNIDYSKREIEEIRKLQGMTEIMKLPSTGKFEDLQQEASYLQREEANALSKMEALKLEYQEQFRILNTLKRDVQRLKDLIVNKSRALGSQFKIWFQEQKQLIREWKQSGNILIEG